MDREKRPHSTITATELKQHLGMYLDYVMANNEVVVTKNGERVVRFDSLSVGFGALSWRSGNGPWTISGAARVSHEEFLEISAKSEARSGIH